MVKTINQAISQDDSIKIAEYIKTMREFLDALEIINREYEHKKWGDVAGIVLGLNIYNVSFMTSTHND